MGEAFTIGKLSPQESLSSTFLPDSKSQTRVRVVHNVRHGHSPVHCIQTPVEARTKWTGAAMPLPPICKTAYLLLVMRRLFVERQIDVVV
jgi:hypothetical protein